jgi:hypothetical protein
VTIWEGWMGGWMDCGSSEFQWFWYQRHRHLVVVFRTNVEFLHSLLFSLLLVHCPQ